jgi:hypothetical protein
MQGAQFVASGSFVLVLSGALSAHGAFALDCGTFTFPVCSKARTQPAQFDGGFNPPAPDGGFGGGNCKGKIAHTPVVMVHGNSDSAIGWAAPAAARSGRPEGPSVYAALIAKGYNDCELFGVTYLDASEQALDHASLNHHQPAKYDILWRFIRAVEEYSGSGQVDIVAHSLGVSMTLAMLDYYTSEKSQNAWASVRRFVNIAGALRGLNSCAFPGSLLQPVCMPAISSGPAPAYEFGFFPSIPYPFTEPLNPWTAPDSEQSLRTAPRRHPSVLFYTLYAGKYDDIQCPGTTAALPQAFDCTEGPRFEPRPNVRAQLDIGAAPGQPAPVWTASVDPVIAATFPNDLGGIGHYGARNDAGAIIVRMLTSDCNGGMCK